MSAQHANKILAEGGACTVEHCPDCDVVHVHFGHVSVRMKPAAFMDACRILFRGANSLMSQEIEARGTRYLSKPASHH